MHAERHVVTLTTAADGSATGYTAVVTGALQAIHYVKTDFAAGVDFTITSEATGESLWTETNVDASTTRRPRGATHDGLGAAALYAAAGQAVRAPVVLANDRVKIQIANGGDTKSGVFHVVIG